MSQKIICIGDMTCAACAQRVEKCIKKLDGVESVSVNFASEKAFVSYDPGLLRLSDIRAAVKKAGYKMLDDEKPKEADRYKKNEIKIQRIKFAIAAIFSLPLLYIAMVPMAGFINLPFAQELHHMMQNFPLAYALTGLFLTLPVIGAGYKFYTVGYKSLWRRSPNMDSLIAIGTSAAFLYSLYNTLQIAAGRFEAVDSLYFESAGVIITLVMLGKYLESVSKGKTGEAIKKLIELAPASALIVHNGAEMEIPVNEVEIGDMVVIKPGAKIPVDGTITEGFTSIDESMLTGESMPVDKNPGDPVYAASLNTTGRIVFRAEKVGSDTVLAQIIRMVENAQGSKAPIAKIADKVSGYFVPAVCIIALAAGIAWFFGSGYDVQFSLTIFISVLVIACPCALGLATPVAVMAGTGIGAEKGIFIKSGEALELAHKINTVVLDKTGTITEGRPVVTDVIQMRNEEEESGNLFLQLAASAERGSEHPLGRAIAAKAAAANLMLFDVENFISITGQGIEAVVKGRNVLAGNQMLMEAKNIALNDLQEDSNRLANEGKTPVYVAVKGRLAGIVAVADAVKPTSRAAVEKLHRMGIKVIMITGDNQKTADAIAKQVGIEKVLSGVLPDAKANAIAELQAGGKTLVAMVGDGINDAPALAQADIGIAIGSGADIAIESAGIVLMHSDLMDVPQAVDLSKKTIRIIKQNLLWAFGYNVAGIPIAAGLLHLFGGPLLNPVIAAAAMSLSSVSVIANALRLRLEAKKWKS